MNPWLFLVLVFSAAGGYMGLFLYAAHWWIHKRPRKPPKPKIFLP